MKLREGKPVVFEWDGVKRIGTIERINIENKMKKYHIRDEAGRLYPGIGVNNPVPGRVLVKLTEQYFSEKVMEADEAKQKLYNELNNKTTEFYNVSALKEEEKKDSK